MLQPPGDRNASELPSTDGNGTANLCAVSLFAGLGGFDEALRRGGIHLCASVEIDPVARALLAYLFPGVPLFDDVREVSGDQLRSTGFDPARGILTAGWPCQDFSMAGRRAGLGGARSGLWWHIVRLADELRPRWIVCENVPGLLSAVCQCPGDESCRRAGRAVRCGKWVTTRDGEHRRRHFVPRVAHTPDGGNCRGGCMATHGGAMGAVLGSLAERGYGWAYRSLDAQYFGVPQQRERVLIVGCLGDRAAPSEILFEPEGRDRDLAAGAAAGTRVAGTLAASAGSGGLGGLGQSGSAVTSRIVETASTLQGGGRRGHRVDAEGAAGGHLIAHALTSEGADASEDGTGRGTPLIVTPLQDGRDRTDRAQNGDGWRDPGEPAYTVDTTGAGAVAVEPGATRDVAHALTSHHGRLDHNQNDLITGRWHGGSNQDQVVAPDGVAPTLSGAGNTHRGHHQPKVMMSAPDTAATVTAGTATGDGVNPPGRRGEDDRNLVAFSSGQAEGVAGDGRASTVRAANGQPGNIASATAVRRLTPLECERLQGLPDNWTARTADGPLSDSARYRLIGNAIALPVAQHVLTRLRDVDAALTEGAADG